MKKGSPNICYLTQLRIPWLYSPIHFQQYQPTHYNDYDNHFYWYSMSQKQVLHDKKSHNRDKCNSLRYSVDFFFVNIWTADIIDGSFINLVHFVFTFFSYGFEDFIWHSTLGWGSLDVFVFIEGHWYCLSESRIGIRNHSHQYPWFLRYNISFRID